CATTSAAWIVFASAELTGAVDWFSAPVGLALLAIIALHRAERRRHQLPAKTRGIVAAELLAMGLVVAPALSETIFEAPVFGALAAAAMIEEGRRRVRRAVRRIGQLTEGWE